jgi:hypothetical protein
MGDHGHFVASRKLREESRARPVMVAGLAWPQLKAAGAGLKKFAL